jgi:hypothetical protein
MMKTIRAAMALAGAAWLATHPAGAMAETLKVPGGYRLIEGTEPAYHELVNATRTNAIEGEKTTTALLLAQVKHPDGSDIFAVGEYVAWCETDRLVRMNVRYYDAAQNALGVDKTVAGGKLSGDPREKHIYTFLCAKWDAQ